MQENFFKPLASPIPLQSEEERGGLSHACLHTLLRARCTKLHNQFQNGF